MTAADVTQLNNNIKFAKLGKEGVKEMLETWVTSEELDQPLQLLVPGMCLQIFRTAISVHTRMHLH